MYSSVFLGKGIFPVVYPTYWFLLAIDFKHYCLTAPKQFVERLLIFNERRMIQSKGSVVLEIDLVYSEIAGVNRSRFFRSLIFDRRRVDSA